MAIKRRQKHYNTVTYDKNQLAIAQERCQELLETQEYRISLERRLNSGNLPSAMEQMMWAYAYGKPFEHLLIGEDPNNPMLGQRLARAEALLLARRTRALNRAQEEKDTAYDDESGDTTD